MPDIVTSNLDEEMISQIVDGLVWVPQDHWDARNNRDFIIDTGALLEEKSEKWAKRLFRRAEFQRLNL